MMKRIGERGHPCLTPVTERISFGEAPLVLIVDVEGIKASRATFSKAGGKCIAVRDCTIASLFMKSKAFWKSVWRRIGFLPVW